VRTAMDIGPPPANALKNTLTTAHFLVEV